MRRTSCTLIKLKSKFNDAKCQVFFNLNLFSINITNNLLHNLYQFLAFFAIAFVVFSINVIWSIPITPNVGYTASTNFPNPI